MQLSQSQSSLQQLQAQFSQERQRLTQEIQELEEEHQQRHKSLQEAHILAFQNMEETKEQEQKACSYGYSKFCREYFSILSAVGISKESTRITTKFPFQLMYCSNTIIQLNLNKTY